VQVRRYIIGVLLAGLLSLSQADSAKTKNGNSYQGTVQFSDGDTIKFKLADSDEVRVFYVRDVEEVKVDSSPTRPGPLENPSSPNRQSAEYWELKGYAEGSSTTGMKSALAGAGGCIGAPVGGYVGGMVGSAADPYGSSVGTCLLLGAAAGGAVGCLGGSGLGSIGQREAASPTSDSVSRAAYLRGFQRGVRYSSNIAMGVGTALSAAGIVCLLLLMFAWSDM
jgi:hypothetical protein